MDSSPVLITNGAEKVLPYHISSDFTIVAKYNGRIKEINDKDNYMVLEYDNVPNGEDKYQMVDLSPVVVKNGAGGFYLSNKLDTDYKEGQKFKAKDVLAYNNKFFGNYSDGVKFNIGTLCKVACISGYDTYEDSTTISTKLSNRIAAEIVMDKHIILGPNANIDFIVKKGDKISVGDPIIVFEQSKEDENVNKLLTNIGEELKEEVIAMGRSTIKSKYTGVIEDIKIYSTIDLEEMSPSLRKVVGDYYKEIGKKRQVVKKYGIKKAENTGNTYTLLDQKLVTKDGKVKGYNVENGVLIEFFIKYRDTASIGDKVVNFAALKGVIGEVIPEGKEMFSEYRPKEEISSIFPPGAVSRRMVPSIFLTMFGNKLLVELKRQACNIFLDGKYDYTKDFDE